MINYLIVATAEGAMLGTFHYDRFLQKKTSAIQVECDSMNGNCMEAWNRGCVVAGAQNFARYA